jgi:hypothetical protein
VALVEEALALREEIAQPVEALSPMSSDKSGLEVVGEDLRHHLLGAHVPLQQAEVRGERVSDLLLAQGCIAHGGLLPGIAG